MILSILKLPQKSIFLNILKSFANFENKDLYDTVFNIVTVYQTRKLPLC